MAASPFLAIITGGSSGLGLAMAHRFAAGGYRVLITGRDAEKLQAAAKEIGPACVPLRFDLDDLAAMPTFVQQIVAEHGRIDVLVNNAGHQSEKASGRNHQCRL